MGRVFSDDTFAVSRCRVWGDVGRLMGGYCVAARKERGGLRDAGPWMLVLRLEPSAESRLGAAYASQLSNEYVSTPVLVVHMA
jgi:hypothetical protein